MRLLLDTRTFLWAIAEPARLSRKVTRMILDERNELLLSSVTLWEIIVKLQSGKLKLDASAEYFQAHMSRLGIREVLPITPVHVYAVLKLPPVHRDPFARLLAAQCAVERLPLLSADDLLRQYPIQVLW
jgi:PIN domain nuclease of toxin-antitoxin system